MKSTETIPFEIPDPGELALLTAAIVESGQRLFSRQLFNNWNDITASLHDDLGLMPAFSQARLNAFFDPVFIVKQQFQLWQGVAVLGREMWLSSLGFKPKAIIDEAEDDRRFQDEFWQNHPVYHFIKQAYLLVARGLYDSLTGVSGLDAQTAGKVEFFTRQFINALAPTNFLATNPAAQREFMRTGGLSALKGLRNLLQDLERGGGQLRISMTDFTAFEPGENIATTPGKVVFQNDMLQLIQYQPATETVLQRPLLIVPPWINKYYILDLRPKNSFIKWAIEQGHTVFVISWINPDDSYAGKTFDDYLLDGTLAAVDAVERATGEKSINAIGYCLGGTLLAATLAYMAAKRNTRIKSATFFASLTDFADPGELGIFIDEEQLQALERRMRRGYLDGAEMATTFNLLRANDLIWSFVVNNYLLGKEPFPFDLLYWNADSTRMPAAMHSFYLRNMYQENRLSEPGGIKLNGTSINLTRIRIPAYFLSTAEDHIAPWHSTYSGTKLLQGANRFVLAGSGHIAGVINPPNPDKPKYGYWTNDDLAGDADNWYAAADHHEGSWWPDWQRWVSSLDATIVAARDPSAGGLTVIEDAPGSYVKKRYS